ncbi:MAG: ABC transporter permease [Cyanobacteria bacterium REEB67]|nr:ABC transporter permease [Cyanobacteria bacterium REEB67]
MHSTIENGPRENRNEIGKASRSPQRPGGPGAFLNQVIAQASKEWSEFKRDKLSMALAFLLPLFSLILFGYGIRLESSSIPMFVEDHDNTYLSREYIARLYATNIIVPTKATQAKSPRDAIDRGLAKMSLIIPHGFSAAIFQQKSAPLRVLVDGTDIANTQIVSNTVQAANLYFIARLVKSRLPEVSVEMVKPQLRIWFNPGRAEPLFIVPGAFGIILWMYPALLAAVAASREKEQDTIIRVYASKVAPMAFLLGKALIYFIVGMALALMVMVVGALLFQIHPIGDPTPLLVATPLYVLTSVLFGLMLGTYSNSQTTAVQATSTAGFFPCLLLSGFVYPIDNIPFPLSLFSIIVPARYFILLTRDAYVRAAGWPAIWQVPLALCAFIVVILFLTWLGLRRMQLKD